MNKIVNLLGTRENQRGCELLHYNFSSRNKNRQSNLLTLAVSCEKRSCLIRNKKEKQHKTKKRLRNG